MNDDFFVIFTNSEPQSGDLPYGPSSIKRKKKKLAMFSLIYYILLLYCTRKSIFVRLIFERFGANKTSFPFLDSKTNRIGF